MELIEYVKLFTAFIVAIGGASVVVVALAKWFGGFLSNRLLDSYNNKHERELETLKYKYANELEKTKAELEKTNYYLLDIQRNSLIYITICGKYCSTLNSKPICYGKKQNLHKFQLSVSK